MKVAITGTTGLIGSVAYRRIAALCSVLTIGRRTGCDRIIDLSDPANVRDMDLDGCDTLVHCAGVVDEDFADAGRAFRQATQGMAALVARAKAAGISRFVYISSAHVYGPFYGEIDENVPANPLHDYAIAHFASEQILRRATSPKFRGLAVRPCAVFGIPQEFVRFRRWSLIPFDFPKSAIECGTIALASHGMQKRNFVGTEDIASTIIHWLTNSSDSTAFRAVNPIGKQTMTVLGFAEMCAAVATEITGLACKVTRPDSSAGDANAFDYKSIYNWSRGQMELAQTVRQIMLLVKEGAAASNPREAAWRS
jgi:UDP-glucose 4-epimerase